MTYYEEYKRNLRRLQEEQRANKTNKAERRTKHRRRHHHKTAGKFKNEFVLSYQLEIIEVFFQTHSAVAYPGWCIACACTPGGLRGAQKGGAKKKEARKGREKRERKGAPKKERREGKENMQKKRKEGRNQKKIGYKKKNTRVATHE